MQVFKVLIKPWDENEKDTSSCTYFNWYLLLGVWSIVERHLSGLTGTAGHLDMHKIRIIGFFFENRLYWQLEVEKNSTEDCSRPHI